ncbi:Beta-lactamase domain-containing protein [Durusdinium trenchii]|uniref:Beta-lactamase domain-containing protein n=1 Tax=Durusdinium trenchii TaxID=1381693 RepID=A0ABP0JAH6_9DINO
MSLLLAGIRRALGSVAFPVRAMCSAACKKASFHDQYVQLLSFGFLSCVIPTVTCWRTNSKQVECKAFSKYLVPPKREVRGVHTQVRELFHITRFGKEIENSGEMMRGTTGAVGGGIYFAATRKECECKAKTNGYLVRAKVFVGRAKCVDINLGSAQGLLRLFLMLGGAGFVQMLQPLVPAYLLGTLMGLGSLAFVDPSAVIAMTMLAALAAWLATASSQVRQQAALNAINVLLQLPVGAPENETFCKLYAEGYDSVELHGFSSGTEYVVYNKDQVEILDVTKVQ